MNAGDSKAKIGMPMGITNPGTLFIVAFLIMPISMLGCKEKNVSEPTAQVSSEQNTVGFTLDYENAEQPQTHHFELFLKSISIEQFHVGQNQPTRYDADTLSKIVLHNVMFPDTKEWTLDKIDIHLKDGTIKSEHSLKAWDVQFYISHGRGAKAVPIEQHFIKQQ